MKHYILASLFLGLVPLSTAYGDVGPDYVCQNKIKTDLPAPAGTIDYWTNVVTSWTNSRSHLVEVFVRGPGLVAKGTELTGSSTDQRWLRPVRDNFEGQGIYLTFRPEECSLISPDLTYCFRDRKEDKSTILAAGLNEKGQSKTYRAATVQAGSIQALLSQKQSLITLIKTNGERVTVGLGCDSREWYAHIPEDEMPRTDLK